MKDGCYHLMSGTGIHLTLAKETDEVLPKRTMNEKTKLSDVGS